MTLDLGRADGGVRGSTGSARIYGKGPGKSMSGLTGLSLSRDSTLVRLGRMLRHRRPLLLLALLAGCASPVAKPPPHRLPAPPPPADTPAPAPAPAPSPIPPVRPPTTSGDMTLAPSPTTSYALPLNPTI